MPTLDKSTVIVIFFIRVSKRNHSKNINKSKTTSISEIPSYSRKYSRLVSPHLIYTMAENETDIFQGNSLSDIQALRRDMALVGAEHGSTVRSF